VTVSIADIDRWDPGDVREVFHATRNRAEAAFEAADGIATLPAFGSWGGDAAEAAKTANEQLRKDLDAQGNEALAVAKAAKRAADDMEQVKSDLAQFEADAAGAGFEIDRASNTVMPGPALQGSMVDLIAAEGKREELQARLTAILAEAVWVDEELAQAINMATGATPIPDEKPPGPPLPQPGTKPADVKKWWDSLSNEQRQELMRTHAAEIGNLDGIPAAVRERVNAARLPEEIAKAQALVDYMRTHPNGKPNPAQLAAWQGARDKLADLQQLQKTLKDHPGVGLLLLDTTSNPKTVLAAVAKGDADNARQVGVTVGGMTTNVRGSVDGMTGEIISQYDQAVELRQLAGVANPESVATIAWLGYEAPGMNFDVTDDALAKAGAGPLNNFYQGLGATSNVPDQEITAFGHSYGSLTTSLALQQGAPVDNVVLYGSPGAELSNASQLGVAPGHAFYMNGITDGVPTTIAGTHNFGPPLSEVPGFTELSSNSGQALPPPYGDGQWHERAYGHSEYPRLGSNGELRMSGYNMAAILAGLPGETIAPPQNLPPPTVPLGPHGMPVPNPNYHP
jgi:Alpha/beta hydrolase